MSEKDGKFVNTFLGAELLADFEEIKEKLGIRSNSDVVRFLIKREARRLRGGKLEQGTAEVELVENRV